MNMAALRHVPLAAARRRHGVTLLVLALPALLLIDALLLVQVPPSLRDGALVLALILLAISIGTWLACFLWACLVMWPWERRHLTAARELRRLSDLPTHEGRAVSRLLPLVVGGLLMGGALWTVLSTLGFFAAPLLWIAVDALYLGLAWQTRRMERRQSVIYYEAPGTSLFAGHRHLYVLQECTGEG